MSQQSRIRLLRFLRIYNVVYRYPTKFILAFYYLLNLIFYQFKKKLVGETAAGWYIVVNGQHDDRRFIF